MKQNSVTQFAQLLKCWLCDVWSDFVLKTNCFLSVDQSRLQSLQLSLHLIGLLSIILTYNSFTGIHSSGSVPTDHQTGVWVCLWEVLWSFSSAQPLSWLLLVWLLYAIHFSLHFTIWLRNGSLLLHRIREDNTLKQWFSFVLCFGQLTGQPLIKPFHLSNLLQMLKDYRIVDIEFFGNFLCSCKRVSFHDPLNESLSASYGQPLYSHIKSLISFSKLLEPPLHFTFVSRSWAKSVIDVVSCLCCFRILFELNLKTKKKQKKNNCLNLLFVKHNLHSLK